MALADPLADLRKRLTGTDPLADLRVKVRDKVPLRPPVSFVGTGYRKRTAEEERRADEAARSGYGGRQPEIRLQPSLGQRTGRLLEQAGQTIQRGISLVTSGEAEPGLPGAVQVLAPIASGMLQGSGAVGRAVGEVVVTPRVRQLARSLGAPWSTTEGLGKLAQFSTETVLDLFNLVAVAPGLAKGVLGRALAQSRAGKAFEKAVQEELARSAHSEALRALRPASRGGTAREIGAEVIRPASMPAPTDIRRPTPADVPTTLSTTSSQGARPLSGQTRTSSRRPFEEMTLAEFVRVNGGLKPEGPLVGEIKRLAPKESGTTGLVNAKSGRTPTNMAELAAESGFPVESGNGGDLLAKLGEDLRGRTVLSFQSVSRIEKEAERKFRKAIDGVSPLDYALGEESGALRLGLIKDSSSRGEIVLLKPPRDLTPWGKWVGSPSKIFSLDQSAAQIQRRAEVLDVNLKREMQSFLHLRDEATRGLTNQQKLNVLQALDGQTLDGEQIFDIGSYLTKLTEEERQAYSRIRKEILDEIERRFRQRGQLSTGMTDYFPHVFRGRWKMTIQGQADETRFLETSGEALTAARKVLDGVPSANVTIRFEGFLFPEEAATLLSRKGYFRLISRIQKALGGKQVLDRDDIVRMTRGVAGIKQPKQRFFGHLEPRIADLQTFDHDLDRALDTYIVGAVKKLETDAFRAEATKLRESVNPDLHNLLGEVDDYINDVTGIPGATESALDDWLVRTFGTKDRPTRRWTGGIAGVIAKWKLGYNPVAAAVNLSQTVVNTYPALGLRWTYAGVRGAADHFLHGTGSKYAQLIDALGIRFYDSKAFGQELATVLGHDSPVQAMYLFNRAEETNRVIAAVGAYEQGLNELKLLPADAIEYAGNLVRRTQFSYSASDLPKLLRNPLARVLGQFRAFTIKELEFIHSLRGAEIPRFMIAAAATGALIVTPHVLVLNEIVKRSTGKDVLADLRQRFPRLVRGIPALFGADLSERIGIGADIEFAVDRPSRLLGPGVGTAIEGVSAATRYAESPSEDNAYALVRALAPTQFRYLLQAYEAAQRKAGARPGEVGKVLETAATEGGRLVGFRGRPLMDVGAQELGLKALGVRTVREGVLRDVIEQAKGREDEVARIRRNALDRAASLREQGRPYAQVIQEANQHLPSGSKLTSSDLERALAMRRRLLPNRVLRTLPRGVRPEFRERLQQFEQGR